jgi:23S rRNA pseudouridine1911/1915/1917 synthase
VVAKNDNAHRSLAEQIKSRTATRKYQALLWGRVPFKHAVIDAPIARHPADRKRMTVYEEMDTTNTYPRRPLDFRLPHGAMTSAPGEAPDSDEVGGAIEFGRIPNSGGARQAVTEIRLLEHLGIFSWIEAILQTGRTHQIRVHMAFAGYPVVGDVIYGGQRRVSADELRGAGLQRLNELIARLHGQALHAYSLAFTHPVSGQRLQFHAPLPREVADLVDFLRRLDER